MKTYTVEEQRQNRQTWVRALRSGKYEQGLGYLKTHPDDADVLGEPVTYCCLGVGCEVLGILGKGGKKIGGCELPSIELYKATGIPKIAEMDLTDANDNKADDFDTISYYIENLGKE